MNITEEEIKFLKAEIDILKKELIENKKNDDKRHKEIKQIQKEHHQDNLKWNRISAIGGTLATPLALLLPLVISWINKEPKKVPNKKVEKTSDLAKLEQKLDNSIIIKLLELEQSAKQEQKLKI